MSHFDTTLLFDLGNEKYLGKVSYFKCFADRLKHDKNGIRDLNQSKIFY